MAGVELSGKLHVQIGIVNLKNKCGDNDGKKTDVCVACVVFFSLSYNRFPPKNILSPPPFLLVFNI